MISLLLLLFLASWSWAKSVRLFVTYMPTYFTNAAAVVDVDVATGNFSIVARVPLPGVFGSPSGWEPTYFFDRSTSLLYLDYQDNFGYLAIYDLKNVKLVAHWMHKDIFFVGFTSFALDNGRLVGTSPVGNDDGTFSFGALDLASHRYRNQSLLLFKAMMDDSLLLESSTDSVFVQADYNQNPNGLCQGGAELCLLKIQASTGKLLDVSETDFTVYKYAHGANSTSAVAFLENSNGRCPGASSGQDFWFGEVNLSNGKSRVISCIDPSIVFQEDEWIGAFDSKKTTFVTGSRYAQTTEFLVFDVKSGKLLLQSTLSGLAAELKTTLGFYWIWAIEFLD